MPKYVCTTCGYAGYPARTTKGSILIEIVLWFFFIIPGLIYSLWRQTSKQTICPKCKNATMIPADSPMGAKLLAEHPAPVVTQTEQHKKGQISPKIAVLIVCLIVFIFLIILAH